MLTDARIKSAKPKLKPYKLFDERGLFLLVYPNGRRGFRFRYRFGGREKLISFGTYPDTTLKVARKKCGVARQQIADNIDPSAKRQSEKVAQADTFEAIATEWIAAGCPGGRGRKAVSPATVEQHRNRLKTFVLPCFGKWPVTDVTAPELLKVLRQIESKGIHETAHRVRSLCSRVFRYAIATGRAERDPAADLQGTLIATKTRNFATVTIPREIGGLLRAIDDYRGQPSVMAALRLAPLVFVRPGELRAAEWDEFDLEAANWRIPARRTKMKATHIVPLATQAVEILMDLQPITGSGKFLFPSLRSQKRCMSDNTLNAALRRMGFGKDEMTTHGFRSMASTRLNELGYPPDVIELQLAHIERNKVRAAYNRAERLAERRKMMQEWADYIDEVRTSSCEGLRTDRT